MATRYITRSTLLMIKLTLTSVAVSRHSLRHRPLIAAASAFHFGRDEGNVFSARSFATRQTTSSLNDPNPNFTNRPPKEMILLDGCDYAHWLVIMKKPEGDPSRDEIIDSYIKTLAMVVGSEEDARMKIYSVSTRHYFAFGALVSEELAYKLKELPRVQWVCPDSYFDVKNKDYGGEPFINGQAVRMTLNITIHDWCSTPSSRSGDRFRHFASIATCSSRLYSKLKNASSSIFFAVPVFVAQNRSVSIG